MLKRERSVAAARLRQPTGDETDPMTVFDLVANTPQAVQWRRTGRRAGSAMSLSDTLAFWVAIPLTEPM